MAFCPNCGSNVEGKFCAKCGATVPTAPSAPAPPGAYQTGPAAPPQAPYSAGPAAPPPAYPPPPAYSTGPGPGQPPAYGAPPPAYGAPPPPPPPPAYGAQQSYQTGPPPPYQGQPGYQAPPPQYQQGPQQPYGGGYQPAPAAGMQENVASLLCYVLGWITGIIFLVMEPYKNNRNIKFHAWQSIIFFGIVTVLQIFLSQILWHILPISMWELWYWTVRIFSLLVLVAWIFLMVQAYNGKRFVIPIIGGIAEQQANK